MSAECWLCQDYGLVLDEDTERPCPMDQWHPKRIQCAARLTMNLVKMNAAVGVMNVWEVGCGEPVPEKQAVQEPVVEGYVGYMQAAYAAMFGGR